MSGSFDLQRFAEAQEPVYAQVCAELRAGQKQSHWMWFVFPQLRGLGHSAMAERFAISGMEEARLYLTHPVLGARLRECVRQVLEIRGKSVEEIFGYPDHLKFRSSMTLFAQAAPEEDIFRRALERFFGGEADEKTLALLRAPNDETV